MVEALKMAARVATLVIAGAAIAILFATAVGILAGSKGLAVITPYIGVAFTFINHWTMGVGGWLIGVGLTLFTIEAAVTVLKFAAMGIGFAMKVSEG